MSRRQTTHASGNHGFHIPAPPAGTRPWAGALRHSMRQIESYCKLRPASTNGSTGRTACQRKGMHWKHGKEIRMPRMHGVPRGRIARRPVPAQTPGPLSLREPCVLPNVLAQQARTHLDHIVVHPTRPLGFQSKPSDVHSSSLAITGTMLLPIHI